MQWILKKFDDTEKLAPALDRLGLTYSWHKVVPFVGFIMPAPEIRDPKSVVFFGSYTLWRYAEAHNLEPGVFRIAPFLREAPWQDYLLNGPGARILTLCDVPAQLVDDGSQWFIRPVEDSKEVAGLVRSTGEIIDLVQKVLALDVADIPNGALRHDTELMLTRPAHILKEWRVWVVDGQVVTWSLYKEGARVTYRPEIDEDARAFAQHMVDLNPGYARAYVIDICRTPDGLHLLETNCINAAGFYAADLVKLAAAIEAL
ncbi:ATP-grasp domain-containing protein [Gymnodinialimonas sp. 2305UL16-5]|uniref:ATP-grasp domain-containing protein n=1 Tax=Gymnodinialimonas mytili TaxID=3126503 RepID=UPI00309A5C76